MAFRRISNRSCLSVSALNACQRAPDRHGPQRVSGASALAFCRCVRDRLLKLQPGDGLNPHTHTLLWRFPCVCSEAENRSGDFISQPRGWETWTPWSRALKRKEKDVAKRRKTPQTVVCLHGWVNYVCLHKSTKSDSIPARLCVFVTHGQRIKARTCSWTWVKYASWLY